MRAGVKLPFFATLLLLLIANVAAAAAPAAPATQDAAAGAEIRRRDGSTSGASHANSPGPSAARVALSLGAVLGLIVLLFVAAKRFLPRAALAHAGGIAGGGAVQVLARTAIAPKQRVVLLQVGRRIIVILENGPNTTTLSEITDADEAAALIAQLQTEKPSSSFSAALGGAMEKFRSAQTTTSPPPTEPLPDLASMRQELEGLARRVRGMVR